MTKEQAFKEINETQEYYVNELIRALNDSKRDCFKTINFTSDTGTGKTKMISILCNKMPEKYFVITTLSKGQLQHQIRNNLSKDVKQNNFVVYGLQDFTANTRLQAEDIISRLPDNTDIVWIRDEGHINTNKWQEIINNRCWKIINFSATNKEEGIRCNFMHTMMLRTVNQQEGTPEDALDKLLEIKKQHKNVKNYNPCAIIRALDKNIEDKVIHCCEERGLSYINITEESFDMSELCKDDNEYDVIINKFKIVEGVDLRRAHVLYMTNEPSNPATTIQIIGRCRRNALLYRDDIDIFNYKNKKLLENTRKCFVYYNVKNMNIDTDENGSLCSAFCDKISCEQLKPNSIISVKNGVMENGLTVIELEGETGEFKIDIDENTGFNIVNPQGEFYKKNKESLNQYVYNDPGRRNRCIGKYLLEDIQNKLTIQELHITHTTFNYSNGQYEEEVTNLGLGYDIEERFDDIIITIPVDTVNEFIKFVEVNLTPEIYQTSKRWAAQYYELRSKTDLDLECNDHLFDSEKDNLNQYLLNTLYYSNVKYFKNKEAALEFKKIRSKNVLLPPNMNSNSEYILRYKNKFKVHPLSYISPKGLVEKLSRRKMAHIYSNSFTRYLTLDRINKLGNKYFSYNKICNDKESAIIGVDLMKSIKTDSNSTVWIEDKSVTSKLSKYSKFNSFIQNKYKNQLNEIIPYLYNGKNKFKFDKKCNSCLGYCAEYYGKYLVYGESFLKNFIKDAQIESKVNYINDYIIVRACMLMYRDMMTEAYGEAVAKVISTISVSKLVQDEYHEFVSTVIKLGKNIANFVVKEFNIKNQLQPGDKLHDPNLSIDHISGLADFINKEKIIDIKCTSSITLTNIKQVLAYHYLSTKRDDLDIKEVIVFDAVNNKSVKVKITE